MKRVGETGIPCVNVGPTRGWIATHNNYYPSEDVLVVVDAAFASAGSRFWQLFFDFNTVVSVRCLVVDVVVVKTFGSCSSRACVFVFCAILGCKWRVLYPLCHWFLYLSSCFVMIISAKTDTLYGSVLGSVDFEFGRQSPITEFKKTPRRVKFFRQ